MKLTKNQNILTTETIILLIGKLVGTKFGKKIFLN